ncbi:MAG: hypothetical protein JJU10_08530 [Idiomarina sp.]|nr:hypothetical protein [Idiomarina sp.]
MRHLHFNSLLALFCVLQITACSSTQIAEPQTRVPIQHHTQALAEQLFTNMPAATRLAIGSLLPAETLTPSTSASYRATMQQVQEGLFSEALRHQFQVQEYRLTTQIHLAEHSEGMLSRNPEYLRNRLAMDYFLTGTYTEVEGGLLVNARVIRLADQTVTHAATHFFPHYADASLAPGTAWRHGGLWRDGTTGEQP